MRQDRDARTLTPNDRTLDPREVRDPSLPTEDGWARNWKVPGLPKVSRTGSRTPSLLSDVVGEGEAVRRQRRVGVC